jgi:hypothetical protein
MRAAYLCLLTMLAGCPGEESGDTDADDTDPGTGGTEATSAGPTGSTTAMATGGEMCTPGEIEECSCTDGSTSDRICLSDGSGFSACDCVGGTTEPQTGSSDDSGSSEGGSGESSGGGSGSGSSTGEPMPECDGSSHPLVDGDLRYCEAGNCYCGDFSVKPPFDVCYPMDIAEPCCPVEVECY